MNLTRNKRRFGSPGYPVIDIAYVSQGKDFSDFLTKVLYFLIHFLPQIPESRRFYQLGILTVTLLGIFPRLLCHPPISQL